tara:strand:+ start:64 stop:204 length:141 start_codon:yes stop_codon:yes gene_type:complete
MSQSKEKKLYMAAKYKRRKEARQIERLLNEPVLDPILDEIIFEEEE